MKRVLLTGASGFIGAHVLRHLLTHTDWTIVCPITFHHSGMPDRIASSFGLHCKRPNHVACEPHEEWLSRVEIVHTDLTASVNNVMLRQLGECDYVLNLASESHVDRSITDPDAFVRNNVDLMLTVLEYARHVRPSVFLQMSTDEVYGPAQEFTRHREWDRILPSNPYSASKAAQEAIAISYWRTYGVPVIITNTMNIVGELQDPEKFVPGVLQRIARGEQVVIHADLRNPDEPKVGSRHWLHARNLADAWLWITRYIPAVQYPDADKPWRLHIVGDELTNLEMAERVFAAWKLVTGEDDRFFDFGLMDVHSTRPGHDLRYALDGSLIESLGWKAPVELGASLDKTVAWTLDHPEWLESHRTR